MSGYTYKGRDTFAQQLAQAKNAAAERQRAVEEKKRQLGELRAAARMAEELAVEEARLAEEIRAITTGIKKLPPPVHGGRRGLWAAAQEAKEYNRRTRTSAA